MFFGTRFKKSFISSDKIVNLTSSIVVIEFVPRRVAMFLVIGIHSVAIPITVRANFSSAVEFRVPIVLVREPNLLKQTFSVCPCSPQKVHRVEKGVLMEFAQLILEIVTKMLLANCLSCWVTREKKFGIGGMSSMSKTCDLILLY